MTAAQLPRVFRYNSVELEDPGLQHDPIDVRNLYSATYPEITSAAIEGPDIKDGKRVYTFRKAVGTKGGREVKDLRAQLEAIAAGKAPAPSKAAHTVVAAEFVRAEQESFRAWERFAGSANHLRRPGDGPHAEVLTAPAELLAPLP